MNSKSKKPNFIFIADSLINADEIRRIYHDGENENICVLYKNGDRDNFPLSREKFDRFVKDIDIDQFFGF